MDQEYWEELERISGLSKETCETHGADWALTSLRRELLHKRRDAKHAAGVLLRWPGETNEEWYRRHTAMCADDKAKVEAVLHLRLLRQDASRTLRDLRNEEPLNPSYSEVREIVRPLLERQDATRRSDRLAKSVVDD